MSWCYLSDTANEDLWSLTDPEYRLYVAALVESNRRLADGFVAADRLPAMVPGLRVETVHTLVIKGWWREVRDGYQAVHYTKREGGWQFSRAQVEKHRADGAKRKADWEARQEREGAEEREGDTSTDTDTKAEPVPERVTERVTEDGKLSCERCHHSSTLKHPVRRVGERCLCDLCTPKEKAS